MAHELLTTMFRHHFSIENDIKKLENFTDFQDEPELKASHVTELNSKKKEFNTSTQLIDCYLNNLTK
jgi:hypothetical protein